VDRRDEDEGGDRQGARLVVGHVRLADASRSGARAPQAEPAREPALRSRRAAADGASGEQELAMDVSALLTIAPAPHAVFERLGTHRQRARLHVRKPKMERDGFTPARGEDAWEPVTWGQFASMIRGVARWLVERGVEPGERVAIFAANSVEWAAA